MTFARPSAFKQIAPIAPGIAPSAYAKSNQSVSAGGKSRSVNKMDVHVQLTSESNFRHHITLVEGRTELEIAFKNDAGTALL